MSAQAEVKAVLEGKCIRGTLTLFGQEYEVYLGNVEISEVKEDRFDYIEKRMVHELERKHIFTLCEV